MISVVGRIDLGKGWSGVGGVILNVVLEEVLLRR